MRREGSEHMRQVFVTRLDRTSSTTLRHVLLCLALSQASCGDVPPPREPVVVPAPQSPPPGPQSGRWDIPTEYEIIDCPEKAKDGLGTILAQYGFATREGRRGEDGSCHFALTALRTIHDFQQAHRLIEEWSTSNLVPLRLTHAHLRFSSVSGEAATDITLTGQATADAAVRVDLAAGDCETPLVRNGRWRVGLSLEARKRVGKRSGSVFVAVAKEGATAYSEIKVMTSEEIPIRFDQLPADSCIRKAANEPR